MSFITRNLIQDATKWTAGTKDLYGNPSWSSPIDVKCRWEDKQTKAVDFQGNEIISNAIVYVDTDFAMGDYIYLGISSATTPPALAKEVRNFQTSPRIRGGDSQRKVTL